MSDQECRAKDPQKCPYHGTKSRSENALLTVEDLEKKLAKLLQSGSKTVPTSQHNTPQQALLNIEDAINFYNVEQDKMQENYLANGQGSARELSGKMYETMIDKLLFTPAGKYQSIVGDNDKLSVVYQHPDNLEDITLNNNLQVDRHVKESEKYYAFIEAKTYLDAAYLKRAVSDMLAIKKSLERDNVPTGRIKFIVFAGQNGIAERTQKSQEARFWTESGASQNDRQKLEIFYIHGSKPKRSSSKPLYKNKFPVDREELERFTRLFPELW